MPEGREPSDPPQDLQRRIDGLREQNHPAKASKEPGVAQAMVLFMSMGFTVAGTMGAGYFIGSYLAHHTGQMLYLPLALVFSVMSAGLVVYQMLRPFLK